MLSDAQWERIAPQLPGKVGDPGSSGRDNRRFIEAVLWIARTGSPWRDLPEAFGKWFRYAIEEELRYVGTPLTSASGKDE